MLEAISPATGLVGTNASAGTTGVGPAVGAAVGAVVEGKPADFSAVLAQFASNATDTLKAGEAAALSGLQGKASVQQVVEAVLSAEQTLQTAIAIRDKVVSAYLELSRMSI